MTAEQDYKNLIVADGPTLYWPLTEGAGSVAYDLSGNSRNGTIVQPNWMHAETGRGDKCIASVYSSAVLSYAATFATTTSGYTVEFWMRVKNMSNYNPMIWGASGWGTFIFECTVSNSYITGANWTPQNYFQGSVSVDTWNYYVITYSTAGQSRLYINGSLVGGPATQTMSTDFTTININPGGASTGLQHFAIYNKELTSDDVSERWNLVAKPALVQSWSWSARGYGLRSPHDRPVGVVWP